MITTNKLTMDLTQRSNSQIIYAVQNDRYSRILELELLENGNPWIIPENVTVVIRYNKSDGKGGEYDTLPDESTAWTADENLLTLSLAPQVLTTPGTVRLSVTLIQEHIQISTFAFLIRVEAALPASGEDSETYYHVPGFLPAPSRAEIGQYFRVSAVDPAGHVTAIEAVMAPDSAANTLEPAEDDIPKVFFGAVLPQTKDDTIMSFRYVSKTMDISGYCKTKAQGNSSMDFPKKNQTVKLYKDTACTEKLKVDFKGWGMQNKFCFKANWIDLTHARNIVSARLWSDVVKSRANYDTIPELLRTSPNQGAVDGFPVKVYAGGVYQGRYTINIPKDAWMANMDDELENHCILCGENYESGCFRAAAEIDESDWTDEVHDTVPESIKTRWNAAIDFIMNSTDTEFAEGIGAYFDIESLIDYYIFGLVICNRDGFGKNQLYMTYDGQKWYATVYDMDCVFGTYFSEIMPYDYPRTSFEDYLHGREGNLLYMRLEKLFLAQIEVRYLELKNGALSLSNIINQFERFTDIAPPCLVEEDYAETTAGGSFTAIPLQGQSNIQQIRDYIVNRYPYAEGYILSLGTDSRLLYRLPEETVFDGVDDYLDTGVKLFETPGDFTIVCDAVLADDAGLSKGIYHAHQHESGGGQVCGGVACNTHWGNTGVYTISGRLASGNTCDVLATVPAAAVRHAAVYESGLLKAVYYAANDGTLAKIMNFEQEQTYSPHGLSLMIGCGVGWWQSNERYTAMTMRKFEVWDYAMSQEDAANALGIPAEPDNGDSLLYRLSQETVLDGVDDYIDTGVKLFDTAKDFTIVCDATKPTNQYAGIYSAWQNGNGEISNEGGVNCANNGENSAEYVFTGATSGGIENCCYCASNVTKHVAVFNGGILNAVYYIGESGEVQHAEMIVGDSPAISFQHDYPLLIGCNVGWWQNRQNFADMTVRNFEIWGYAMDAEEAAAKLI